MKKYILVKPESLKKILDSFANQEEFQEFTESLSSTIDEILFTSQLASRNKEDHETYTVLCVKTLFILGLFCQQNMDIIHQIVNAIEYTDITKEQIEKISEDKGIDD